MDDNSSERFYTYIREKGITPYAIRRFRALIYRFYSGQARHTLPWRLTIDPYHILLSEIMLQQTQVERVLTKYPPFIKQFPDFASVAGASLRSLYAAWQGLGYNRRALALKEIARTVTSPPYNGLLPSERDELMKMPFIGQSTAGAIAAFAFSKPSVFIETNIRRVFIRFFFRNEENVSDRMIIPLIKRTLDKKDPRNWYYALMDYGAYLGKLGENPNLKSAHYRKQSPFAGSNRQLRGRVVRFLHEVHTVSEEDLQRYLDIPYNKMQALIVQLMREGFITREKKTIIMS